MSSYWVVLSNSMEHDERTHTRTDSREIRHENFPFTFTFSCCLLLFNKSFPFLNNHIIKLTFLFGDTQFRNFNPSGFMPPAAQSGYRRTFSLLLSPQSHATSLPGPWKTIQFWGVEIIIQHKVFEICLFHSA
jgi:hypothetical protein